MPKKKKQSNPARTLGLIIIALAGLVFVVKTLLHGNNVALFNPKGSIAQEQLHLMLLTTGIMLIIAIPTLFFLYFTAWKYRETNDKPKRDVPTGKRKGLNAAIWLLPATFALVLSLVMWPATHRLEPQKKIAADAKPMTIQVVAQRWKWLFIYPEQKIATVNYVQIPKDTPVTFELTADETPMSSFWIPNLGGMLYAMNGHVNQLNLLPNTLGDYPGSSAEINGAGFAGMKFTARVSSAGDFDQWVNTVQQSGNALNDATYKKLLQPSENNPVALYSTVEADLYDTIVMKYMGSMDMGEGRSHGSTEESHEPTEHGAHHE